MQGPALNTIMKSHKTILTKFLESDDRPEGTLGYHELQGFLFTVCCSPQLITPSEWMPIIFNEQEAGYRNEAEAEIIVASILALYNTINEGVLEGGLTKPADLDVKDNALDNIGENTSLGQWCNGFFMGHDWLSDLWDTYIPEDLREELASCLMVLTAFSSEKLANAYYKEFAESSGKTIEDHAETLLALFDGAMNSYALIGRSIYTALNEQDTYQQPIVNENKVGRNDPCPCGSGKKYKKCCLH